MTKLNAAWFLSFKGDPKDKAQLEEIIRNSSIVRDLLATYLKFKIKELDALKASDYTNPSWAYLQADHNGALRVLRELLTIVDLGELK